MNRHLSNEEISAWAGGEVSPACEEHARECAECRGELERLLSALGEFRGAARAWSRSQGAEAVPHDWRPSRARRFRSPVIRWAAAAAVLALATAAPLYRNSLERRRAAQAAATARADTLLLQQVDFEISQAVPVPMEPLVSLISQPDSSNTSQQGTAK